MRFFLEIAWRKKNVAKKWGRISFRRKNLRNVDLLFRKPVPHWEVLSCWVCWPEWMQKVDLSVSVLKVIYARTICIQANTWHFCMLHSWVVTDCWPKFANFAWYRLISLMLCTGFLRVRFDVNVFFSYFLYTFLKHHLRIGSSREEPPIYHVC